MWGRSRCLRRGARRRHLSRVRPGGCGEPLPDVLRIRLTHGQGRRPVGLDAGRGAALVGHGDVGQPPGAGDRFDPGSADFEATGSTGCPVPTATPVVAGDVWPGFYSATLVGAETRGYLD